jgi:hypothetical protein
MLREPNGKTRFGGFFYGAPSFGVHMRVYS